MKKPENFEKITYEYQKLLGINWQIRIEAITNVGNGDFSRVWLMGNDDEICSAQIGRALYFDIFWDKNKCEVFAPEIGNGEFGPHVKDYNIDPIYFKTPDKFKEWLGVLLEDMMSEFNLQDRSGVSFGTTALSFLVKSDTDGGVSYSVDYHNKNWSCTCKGFVYSKAIPQTCKHILKVKQ